MVLVALAISVSIQLVGTLLIFTLLVGPAATAIRLTQRPIFALLVASSLGVGYVVAGISLALFFETWPASFFIATISFLVYLPVRLLSPLWLGRKREPGQSPPAVAPLPRKEAISSGGIS
jgi:zinc/manganese transport system permease protein